MRIGKVEAAVLIQWFGIGEANAIIPVAVLLVNVLKGISCKGEGLVLVTQVRYILVRIVL